MADVGPRQFSGGMNDYALSYKTVPCHLCVLSASQPSRVGSPLSACHAELLEFSDHCVFVCVFSAP